MDDEETKAVATIGAGPAAKELYTDLAKPAAVEMSKNLLATAKLVTYALAPLHGIVRGLDKVREWVVRATSERLKDVPPENVQTPKPNVAGPILLQLPMVMEEDDLREMYANLLASAMNKATASNAHPAYASVIQQLSGDEALVIRQLAAVGDKLDLHEETGEDGGPVDDEEIWLAQRFENLCKEAGATTPDLSDSYLDNLLRLKILVEERWTESKVETPRWGSGPALTTLVHRRITLTAFGARFIAACVAAAYTGQVARRLLFSCAMADEDSGDEGDITGGSDLFPRLPWPDPTQGLTNPGPWPLDASLKWSWSTDGWIGRIMGYREAAQAVFEQMTAHDSLVNVLIFPLFFLWRHAIELQLKMLIDRGQPVLKREVSYPKHHDLKEAWAIAREVVLELEPNGGPDIEDVDRLIGQLAALDPDSFAFRYHETKKGNPSLSPSLETLNAGEVNKALSAVSQFLDGVGDMLEEARGWMDDRDREEY